MDIKQGGDDKKLFPFVWGIVEEIKGYNEIMIHTPSSEIVCGGRSPNYDMGYKNRLEIKIKSSLPTKTFIFNGTSSIEKGDKIKAQILKADKQNNYSINELGVPVIDQIFVSRDFQKEEIILCIQKRKANKTVRTDYSVEYEILKKQGLIS